MPDGVTARNYEIPLVEGWTTEAQLTLPTDGAAPYPVVVLVHGSGPNDLNEALPTAAGGTVSVFRPIAGRLSSEGLAVLRYNKRGVIGEGPELSDDPTLLRPDDPDTVYTVDAADVVAFAATIPEVDPDRIFLLGHSEGSLDVANIAGGHITDSSGATPDIAGVAAMGVVGLPFEEILRYQLIDRNLDYLATFDGDGDGSLTPPELDALPPEVSAQLLLAGSLNPVLDLDGDGSLEVFAEAGPALVDLTGFDDYPDLTVDPDLPALIRSIEANGTVTERLPAYDGPVLLLNGRNDAQTVARNAEVAEAALAEAGHPDHTLILYDGLGHAMNRTDLYQADFGEPDEVVLDDLAGWLRSRAGLD